MLTSTGVRLPDEERKARIQKKLLRLDQEQRNKQPSAQWSTSFPLTASQGRETSDNCATTRPCENPGLASVPEAIPAAFPFFKLPLELQDRICAFAISEARRGNEAHMAYIFNNRSVQVLKAVNGKPDQVPALLRASRELRQITFPLYLKTSKFIIKSAPRMDQQCPFSKWVSIIGRSNAKLVQHIAISFYEAQRVYVELTVQPQPGAFPCGSVTLEWPQSRKGTTVTTVMIVKRALGSRYPQVSINEHTGKPYTVQTDDVVDLVSRFFWIGKQAAGGVSRKKAATRGFTMRDALWGGHSKGTLG